MMKSQRSFEKDHKTSVVRGVTPPRQLAIKKLRVG
jgi:hypothetical protein